MHKEMELIPKTLLYKYMYLFIFITIFLISILGLYNKSTTSSSLLSRVILVASNNAIR
jgi:hypothetical protein